MSTYDKILAELGVDDTESVDPEEIKRITQLLREIQILAAQVAKDNDTPDTIEILKAVKAGMGLLLGMTAQQARAYNHAVSIGQDTSHPAMSSANGNGRQPLALGGNSPATKPAANPLVDSFAQAVSRGDNATVLAIGYLLDPTNRDWKVADDGTGQPVLESVARLSNELNGVRQRLNEVLDATDPVVDMATNMVPSVQSLQQRAKDEHGLEAGPHPDQLTELGTNLAALKTTLRHARSGGRNSGRSRVRNNPNS